MAGQSANFIAKLNGTLIKGNILSDADIAKIKEYQGKVTSLEGQVAEIKKQVEASNKFQRELATKDFYTDEQYKDEMKENVIYMVAFRDGKFVAPNTSGEQFWPNGQAPEYFQLVRLDAEKKIQKMGMEKYAPDLDGVLSKTADNEFSGYMMRVVEADAADNGDSVAYMTKLKGVTTVETNPEKEVFTGHLALAGDGQKLFAHTGVVKKDGTRQASLGVYQQNGTGAGEVCLSSSKDGSVVKFEIPQPTGTPGDKEAATVKFVNDKIKTAVDAIPDATDSVKGLVTLSDAIDGTETAAEGHKAATPKAVKDAVDHVKGEINPKIEAITKVIGNNAEKAALKDAANIFTKSQTVQGEVSGTEEKGAFAIKATKYDGKTGEFDEDKTELNGGIKVADKNDRTVGQFSVSAKVDGREIGIYAQAADGSYHGLRIETNKAATKDSIKAFAPNTPTAAVGQEIATAKFVADKIKALNHVQLKYQASAPSDDDVVENTLVFYNATNLL